LIFMVFFSPERGKFPLSPQRELTGEPRNIISILQIIICK
jgi:hypothetical protein